MNPRASAVLLAILVSLASSLRAQAPSLRPLEPGHWSYSLLETVHALGMDPAWDPWQEPVLAATVGEVLAEAADEGRPETKALKHWAELLDRETGLTRGRAGRGASGLVAATLGFEASDALPGEDRRVFGSVRGELWASEGFTVWAEGGASARSDQVLQSGGLAFRRGSFQALAGRLNLRTGQGLSPLLLSGAGRFDGIWLGSARPVKLPALGLLGPVSAHFFVGPGLNTPPADSVPGGMESWFLSAGVKVRPHPRVELGVLRTARFAGDSVEAATLGNLLETFTLGGTRSDFDDSQGELSVRVRVDVGSVVATPYLSLGFEDPEALWEDPALVAGVLVPFQIREDLVSLRYEYTGFGPRAFWCRGCEYVFHQWYRHRAYGLYTQDGRLLGSSLGGYGSAHRLEIRHWSASRPLRGRAVLFRERREGVLPGRPIGDNLLLGRWPGVRRGILLELAVRPALGWEIQLDAAVTSTEDGGENGMAISVRALDVFD